MTACWPIHARKKCVNRKLNDQPKRSIRQSYQLFGCHPRRRVSLTANEVHQLLEMVEQIRMEVDQLRQSSNMQNIGYLSYAILKLQQFMGQLNLPSSRLNRVKTSLQQVLQVMRHDQPSLADLSTGLQNTLNDLLLFISDEINNPKQDTSEIQSIRLTLFHINVRLTAFDFERNRRMIPLGAAGPTGPSGPTGAIGPMGPVTIHE